MDHVRIKIPSFRINGEFRTQTNKRWIYFFAIFFTVLLASAAYCCIDGNLDRFFHGYDNCGNVCGSKNYDANIQGCEQRNMENLPLLKVAKNNWEKDICVSQCGDDYIEIFNRCFFVSKTEEARGALKEVKGTVAHDLITTSPAIITVTALSVISSLVLLLMFRYVINYVISFVCVAFVMLELTISVKLWIDTIDESTSVKIFAILSSIVTLLTLLVLFIIRNKIKLVGRIFNEASRTLIDVPMIMLQPVITLLVILIAFLIFFYFMLIISYSGKFEQQENKIVIVRNAFFYIAGALNVFGYIWFYQFVIGCQHFIIAGAVSKWYFTRDKTKLGQPIAIAYHNLLYYHLGSICLGSCLISIFKIIRMIFKCLKLSLLRNKNPNVCCIGCCIEKLISTLERLLKYLVRNAYILVAKDGTPFLESGRKASEMIVERLFNFISLNYIGDLILLFGKLFVVLITVFIGCKIVDGQPGVTSITFPIVISGLISLTIVHCFINVFEMTVDTIFLCYCEDCDENGSEEKPYYMSQSLKEIMNEMNGSA